MNFIERCTEIEKNNLNLFHKMRAIIRTKHTQWRQKSLQGRKCHPIEQKLMFSKCTARSTRKGWECILAWFDASSTECSIKPIKQINWSVRL